MQSGDCWRDTPQREAGIPRLTGDQLCCCHSESLKIQIHRDLGSVSPCWILRICVIKALWAALVCRPSRGGSPSHPESHGDKILLKKLAQQQCMQMTLPPPRNAHRPWFPPIPLGVPSQTPFLDPFLLDLKASTGGLSTLELILGSFSSLST